MRRCHWSSMDPQRRSMIELFRRMLYRSGPLCEDQTDVVRYEASNIRCKGDSLLLLLLRYQHCTKRLACDAGHP